ncbi:hypothetical protein DLREEDagrD3_00260 [Denitratisoma sp. agr-D3]
MIDFSSIPSVITATLTLFCFFIVLELVLPPDLEERYWEQIKAATFILLGISALAFHFHEKDNVMLDVRGAVLVVATLFGGYRIGAATAVAEGIGRALLGGPVLGAGLASIGISYLFCCLIRRLGRLDEQGSISISLIIVSGVTVGVVEALCLFLVQPFDYGQSLFFLAGSDILLIQSVSTLLFGGLFKLQNDRRLARAEVLHNSVALRHTLKQSIASLSSAMMHRDPTTAGHERRVADLAVAVGRELGLDESRLEGLQLAALVHDVGQIQVPAEILTRPRRLLPQEFDLIKHHCDAGNEILKDVQFIWPIAEVISQHHENVDGSGYPRGLKADQIRLEAKILRVCDSLEAMLSHRPFRRAYDLAYAMDQLRAFSGSHYDPTVVATCIRVLEQQGIGFLSETKAAA